MQSARRLLGGFCCNSGSVPPITQSNMAICAILYVRFGAGRCEGLGLVERNDWLSSGDVDRSEGLAMDVLLELWDLCRRVDGCSGLTAVDGKDCN